RRELARFDEDLVVGPHVRTCLHEDFVGWISRRRGGRRIRFERFDLAAKRADFSKELGQLALPIRTFLVAHDASCSVDRCGTGTARQWPIAGRKVNDVGASRRRHPAQATRGGLRTFSWPSGEGNSARILSLDETSCVRSVGRRYCCLASAGRCSRLRGLPLVVGSSHCQVSVKLLPTLRRPLPKTRHSVSNA